MKLISDLKVGDKLFIIIVDGWLFDVGEVIEATEAYIKVQFYIYTDKHYLWRYKKSVYNGLYYYYFTDENQAIEVFKQGLKWQE